MKRVVNATVVTLSNHHSHNHHTNAFAAKRNRRRDAKSLVCFSVLCILLFTSYIFTIRAVIQMQAAVTDADADYGRLKTKSETRLSKNAAVTIKKKMILREKGESVSKLAGLIAPPSSSSLPLHGRGYDHDENFAYTAALQSLQELTQSPPLGSIVCPSPHFTPIYDRIVYTTINDTDTTTDSFAAHRKIPRIIHISFNDRCVPNELAESITRWQEALPDHAMFFHDDQAVQRLIGVENRNSQLWHFSEDFPGLRSSLRCVKFKGAMLIDIWRMLIVWTYGGIYTDIDNWPGPKFNAHTTIRDEDSFFSLSDCKERPSQWLFGMTPNHPIAIFTLQDISRRILKIKNIARPRVVHTTGPQTLKTAFRKFNLLLEQNTTIFGNSSYFTQVQKVDLAESAQYAQISLGNTFDEIVDHYFDEVSHTTYRNITKRQKTEILSGVKHWTEDVKLGKGKANVTIKESTKYADSGAQLDANTTAKNANDEERAIPYDGFSCMDYLATLD